METPSPATAQTARGPLVSVGIPSYNRAVVVGDAVRSVLQQTHSHLEVIVVDDASTDETAAAIARIDDPRLRYLRHGTNRGGADARNTAIAAATGEDVAFLDSDDLWHPDKLARQLAALTACPERTVCYTRVEATTPGQPSAFYPKRGIAPDELVANYLFLGEGGDGAMFTSTLLLARSLFDEVRFRPGLKKHHDLDLVLRLEAAGARFHYLDAPLVQWRNDPSQRDRLTNCPDYEFSHRWIDTCPVAIPRAAKFGFLRGWVLPALIARNRNPLLAEWILLNNWLHGTIAGTAFVKQSYFLTKKYTYNQFGWEFS